MAICSRDLSLVRLATLIVTARLPEIREQIERALNHGVQPGELCEVIARLALYSGWTTALSASADAKAVFIDRGLVEELLPDEEGILAGKDGRRGRRSLSAIDKAVGPIFEGPLDYTCHALFTILASGLD